MMMAKVCSSWRSSLCCWTGDERRRRSQFSFPFLASFFSHTPHKLTDERYDFSLLSPLCCARATGAERRRRVDRAVGRLCSCWPLLLLSVFAADDEGRETGATHKKKGEEKKGKMKRRRKNLKVAAAQAHGFQLLGGPG